MRENLALLLVAVASVSGLYAAASQTTPCRLDRAVVLAPYAHSKTASIEEWRDSRLALQRFTGCSPRDVDQQSRRVFFEAVSSEFQADHKAEIERWRTLHPHSDDGIDTAIGILQSELRTFMGQLVDRNDAASKDVVLRYGDAKAIAALGPSVKQRAISMLGNSVTFYGIGNRYHSQEEAIQVLGYWIDPENREFSPSEKAEFTQMLTSLVPHIQSGVSPYEDRYFQAALKALAHSDSAEAEIALASWMDTQKEHGNSLYHEASRSLTAVRTRRGKGNHS